MISIIDNKKGCLKHPHLLIYNFYNILTQFLANLFIVQSTDKIHF